MFCLYSFKININSIKYCRLIVGLVFLFQVMSKYSTIKKTTLVVVGCLFILFSPSKFMSKYLV